MLRSQWRSRLPLDSTLLLSALPPAHAESSFEIDAKAAEAAGEQRLRIMLQALLSDRFKLALTRSTKVLPVYELTVAKGGPSLREVKPGAPVPSPARADPPLIRLFFV